MIWTRAQSRTDPRQNVYHKKAQNQQFLIIILKKKTLRFWSGDFSKNLQLFQEIFIFHWFLLNFTGSELGWSAETLWNSIGISWKWRFLEKVQNFRENPPTKISGFCFLIENCWFPAFFMMLRLEGVRADFSLRPDHLRWTGSTTREILSGLMARVERPGVCLTRSGSPVPVRL